MLDFMIHNGNGLSASGDVASRIIHADGDPRVLRPWYDPKTKMSYIAQNQGGGVVKAVPIGNATSYLRKDDWLVIDQAIVKAAKPRLKLVADLRDRGLTFDIPNGMGKTVLATERQSDINEAVVSMDGLRESQNDRPQFDIQNLPLPIVHKDFQFSARQIMASRNGGSPLDTSTAELAARRVAEIVEQLATGTLTGITFGGGTVYGLTNFPGRMTKVMTAPTGTNGTTTVNEILAMRLQAQNQYHFGPYMLYTSLDWDTYLDEDYRPTVADSSTLRQRILKINGILGLTTLDYLPAKTMVLVQLTPEIIRMVLGMDIITVQWESKGGMQINFKVMCIQVPQVRADINGNTGIVHGAYP